MVELHPPRRVSQIVERSTLCTEGAIYARRNQPCSAVFDFFASASGLDVHIHRSFLSLMFTVFIFVRRVHFVRLSHGFDKCLGRSCKSGFVPKCRELAARSRRQFSDHAFRGFRNFCRTVLVSHKSRSVPKPRLLGQKLGQITPVLSIIYAVLSHLSHCPSVPLTTKIAKPFPCNTDLVFSFQIGLCRCPMSRCPIPPRA